MGYAENKIPDVTEIDPTLSTDFSTNNELHHSIYELVIPSIRSVLDIQSEKKSNPEIDDIHLGPIETYIRPQGTNLVKNSTSQANLTSIRTPNSRYGEDIDMDYGMD